MSNFIEETMDDNLPDFVFLGGTCNGSTWRDELIPKLTEREIFFFNPVVEDWDMEAKKAEDLAKENARWELYVITPEMTGVYSIAELVYKACTDPDNLIVCVPEDPRWDEGKLRSVRASIELAITGSTHELAWCHDLDRVAEYLKELRDNG
jgi:hypothetical protein